MTARSGRRTTSWVASKPGFAAALTRMVKKSIQANFQINVTKTAV